jgi:hypothetical protein
MAAIFEHMGLRLGPGGAKGSSEQERALGWVRIIGAMEEAGGGGSGCLVGYDSLGTLAKRTRLVLSLEIGGVDEDHGVGARHGDIRGLVGKASDEVTAGREANHRDTTRVGVPLDGASTGNLERAPGVVQRGDPRAGGVAAGHAIADDRRRIAELVEAAGNAHTLVVMGEYVVTAAREDEDEGGAGLRCREGLDVRGMDMGEMTGLLEGATGIGSCAGRERFGGRRCLPKRDTRGG